MFNNHLKNGCRKRTRDEEEEDCEECLPISKRINRLCIRQSSDGWSEDQIQENSQPGTSFNDNPNARPARDQQPQPLFNYAPAPPVNPPSNSVPSQLPRETHPDTDTPLGVPAESVRVPSADSGIDLSGGDYEPELGAQDNPIYFHINGTLFEANRHRMHRQQQQVDSIDADFIPEGSRYPHQ